LVADENNIGKSVLIAGNGPSLAAIDYSRLPRDIEVWRTNQFYKECKYYVGKNIDKYFCGDALNSVIYGYFFTIWQAARRGEYNPLNAGEFYCSFSKGPREPFTDFIACLYSFAERHNLTELLEFKYQCDLPPRTSPQTGTFMIAFAAVLGYSNIYLAGIDVDYTKSAYAFEQQALPAAQLNPLLRFHPAEVQYKLIDLVAKLFPKSVLYSVSPSSPISQHIQLAPIINEYPEGYAPPDKPEGYIKEAVKINMLEPPASPLEVRYEQLAKTLSELKTETTKQNNAQARQIDVLSGYFVAFNRAIDNFTTKFDSLIAEQRRYPKWLVLLACCFIPNKAKRKALRKKYARGYEQQTFKNGAQ
jgi:alpha-2,3 sialyltransferase